MTDEDKPKPVSQLKLPPLIIDEEDGIIVEKYFIKQRNKMCHCASGLKAKNCHLKKVTFFDYLKLQNMKMKEE